MEASSSSSSSSWLWLSSPSWTIFVATSRTLLMASLAILTAAVQTRRTTMMMLAVMHPRSLFCPVEAFLPPLTVGAFGSVSSRAGPGRDTSRTPGAGIGGLDRTPSSERWPSIGDSRRSSRSRGRPCPCPRPRPRLHPRRARELSSPRTALGAGWFGRNGGDTSSSEVVSVGELVGSGSYGTVHLCRIVGGKNGNGKTERGGGGKGGDGEVYVGKRAWTYDELVQKAEEIKAEMGRESESESESGSSSSLSPLPKASAGASSGKTWIESDQKIRERADRCRYYIDVERHCLAKLNSVLSAAKQEDKKRSVGSTKKGVALDPRLVANLVATRCDNDGREWLLFRLVPRAVGLGNSDSAKTLATKTTTTPALTLSDAMDLDWSDQHALDPDAGDEQHHHLYIVQREMGLPSDSTFADTLDAVLLALLRCVSACHRGNVVHRDVKPQNLLCDAERRGFVLIDFGSAADLDPSSSYSYYYSSSEENNGRVGVGGVKGIGGGLSRIFGVNGGRVGLEDSTLVAISPIYAAPETFVRWDRAPLNFDTFSCALIFCQLLFNLLDERTDAAFHQQLEYAKYDLDTWLERKFESTLTPAGVDDAFAYLAKRPGLWTLLKDMLNRNPELRASSKIALRRFQEIIDAAKDNKKVSLDKADGEYFAAFLSSLESYDREGPAKEQEQEEGGPQTVAAGVVTEERYIAPRPLHYVATFERDYPLGLVLSEVDSKDDGGGGGEEEEEEGDPEAKEAWARATRAAKPGEVYVRGITEGGQADRMGIFEIGDRLRAVGEVPVFDMGFERVVDMLGKQPRSAKTVKLHFDRRSAARAHKYKKGASHKAKVVGQGAWSSIGRRKAQEDAFVLHEIKGESENAVLMAAIFDGHGGMAASCTASQLLPSLFSAELATLATTTPDGAEGTTLHRRLRSVLEAAWDVTCSSYRSGCTDTEECTADYDPREGIVYANMASKDLVAGTTASAAVLSVSEEGADMVTVLNCGDSRTLLVGRVRGVPEEGRRLRNESVVHFATRDHSPDDELEMERLRLGMDKGYSQPKRSLSRWRVQVGDYQYALSRSLEGPFATARGIVSDPDVTDIDLVEMLSERERCVLVIASDGMFEVMDNEQVGREVLKMREMGLTANDCAKYICRMANEKGTSDNVSAVIVYLD